MNEFSCLYYQLQPRLYLSLKTKLHYVSEDNSLQIIFLSCSINSGISVIDLLGDDGAHGTVKEIPVHAPESHVAFSVEGMIFTYIHIFFIFLSL